MNEDRKHRDILRRVAYRAMTDRGLAPDFSTQALAEVDRIQGPAVEGVGSVRDLTALLWASIDNDDSLDLDQLTVAEMLPEDKTRVLVAIADVDVLVCNESAIDKHARHNTTSVYTAGGIFPMLPEKLSTDMTSLALGEDRLALVIDMVLAMDGSVQNSAIYMARVHNKAKLAYNSVAAWLEGREPMPEAVAAVAGLDENLRLQDEIAQKMKRLRHTHGALTLETIEANPVFENDQVSELVPEKKNRATEIVEDFMIAANGVTARFLSAKGSPSIRRVVRTPKRWERIIEIAAQYGYTLPGEANSKALEEFLTQQRAKDPVRFPDLSLSVIKLLGSGEYIAEPPEGRAPGHFGLAVKDYTHSTAPNRRYTDLITQRLLKAVLAGQRCPYGMDELDALAKHCTLQEDAANKVERQVGKSAAALLLENRIDETFDAVVTGAAAKGTWVRLLTMPIEGKLIEGHEGADVGDKMHVKLVSVSVERGYIDFVKVATPHHH